MSLLGGLCLSFGFLVAFPLGVAIILRMMSFYLDYILYFCVYFIHIKMDYQTCILANGLRVIYQPDRSDVAYCGMVVNAGSRDESETEEGMAHFVEHMLFKGTSKRRSTHIINRLENVGGEMNAFTSKEETVIYAVILKDYLERAVDLIADVTFHSVFPQKEIEKEVEVILDEIDSYRDSPSELIYDDFEDLLFSEHSLGHHILGKPELLEKYTTQDALNFTRRLYYPENMVFFVSGNIPFKKVVYWAEKYFCFDRQSEFRAERTVPGSYTPIRKNVTKGTHQVHVAVGNRAYDYYHPDRMAMHLLNNILGGPGMSSLLNLSLREKRGLVYSVDSSYQPFSDTGQWCVYFGSDEESAEKCEKLIYAELEKMRKQRISDTLLKKYKLQFQGQMAIASENKENLALSLGKSFLRYGKFDDLKTVQKKIEAITSEQIYRVANDIFVPEQLTVLRYN